MQVNSADESVYSLLTYNQKQREIVCELQPIENITIFFT